MDLLSIVCCLLVYLAWLMFETPSCVLIMIMKKTNMMDWWHAYLFFLDTSHNKNHFCEQPPSSTKGFSYMWMPDPWIVSGQQAVYSILPPELRPMADGTHWFNCNVGCIFDWYSSHHAKGSARKDPNCCQMFCNWGESNVSNDFGQAICHAFHLV